MTSLGGPEPRGKLERVPTSTGQLLNYLIVVILTSQLLYLSRLVSIRECARSQRFPDI